MTIQWIDKALRAPEPADADALGCVLVWHVYQRCMVMGLREAIKNRYVTHWARLPEGPEGRENE